jgi:hypothetical protein
MTARGERMLVGERFSGRAGGVYRVGLGAGAPLRSRGPADLDRPLPVGL